MHIILSYLVGLLGIHYTSYNSNGLDANRLCHHKIFVFYGMLIVALRRQYCYPPVSNYMHLTYRSLFFIEPDQVPGSHTASFHTTNGGGGVTLVYHKLVPVVWRCQCMNVLQHAQVHQCIMIYLATDIYCSYG